MIPQNDQKGVFRKTQEPQPSSKSDRVLFFLSQKSRSLLFSSLRFILELAGGEMCIREGGTMKHTIKRRNGYQHHDTCFRGEHRHIDDQEEQNSRRQDGKGELRERERRGEKRNVEIMSTWERGRRGRTKSKTCKDKRRLHRQTLVH
jgi:hypothetical protein